jgi:hypothetical protein
VNKAGNAQGRVVPVSSFAIEAILDLVVGEIFPRIVSNQDPDT